MNYIQVELGGQLRGWKVNQMTIEIWSKLLNQDAFNSSSNYGAVYGGLVANCEAKRIEPDFTFEQVCDWVDELNLIDTGVVVMQQIKEAFEESQYFIKIIEKLNVALVTKEPDKKKAQRKK